MLLTIAGFTIRGACILLTIADFEIASGIDYADI